MGGMTGNSPLAVFQVLSVYRTTFDRLLAVAQPPMAGLVANPTGTSVSEILTAERDLKEQKGSLQEEVEARGHKVLFYPKFHCELNLIEPYWRQEKWHTGGYCGWTLEGPPCLSSSRLEEVYLGVSTAL